jgi:2-hydroxy-3-keto-5-methylthiopentenyl-1-phosphate phosphatase
MGRSHRPTREEADQKALELLQHKIKLREQFKEQFYTEEAKTQDTRIVYSEMKYLPSPIYKTITKSPTRYVKDILT